MAPVFCRLQVLFWILQITWGENQDFSKHPNWGLLPHGSCGHSHSSSLKPRISGGRNTSITELPWLVAIYSYEDRLPTPLYDGVGCIISDRYILTDFFSASPLGDPTTNPARFDPTSMRVGVGKTQGTDFQQGINLEVESVTVNPNFSVCFDGMRTSVTDNIVLIRTKEKITFTDTIQPICLPFGINVKDFSKETKFEVDGWGIIDPGSQSYILQSKEVTILPKEDCSLESRRAFIKSRWPEFLKDLDTTALNISCIRPPDERQLCVSGDKGGDGGAPLMKSVENKSNAYFMFGINADSLNIGPAVYTNINSYLQWILDTIKP